MYPTIRDDLKITRFFIRNLGSGQALCFLNLAIFGTFRVIFEEYFLFLPIQKNFLDIGKDIGPLSYLIFFSLGGSNFL